MSLKIGVTGGIGSGKTTVCKIFQVLGAPVLDADSLAKEIMQTDVELIENIKKIFGRASYTSEGVLDRQFLASQVFSDLEKLNQLNSIVHPAVIRAGEEWSAKQTARYTIKEAALLFESGSYKLNDFNILVFADEDIRIKRVMERDSVDVESVKSRINKQMPELEKRALADFVVINQDPYALIPQILALHEKFKSNS